MAQNAENFGTNRVVLDDANEPILTVFVRGEAEPRLVLDLSGVLRSGDGVTAPSADFDVPGTLTADNIGTGSILTTYVIVGGNVYWSSGAGDPEGELVAVVGSLYSRTDGGTGTTLYIKETGTGDTGWVAVA